ncbi:MAG: ATPase, T2SS/T4P/T4SS family [Kiritimatiellia bacterium]|jgi:pilus assembly protein CpaF|nr:ATPase, T2SS/T4P/T4SS family [Kiritimatiellia bacterium]MDP6631171.1 ATPase, T2SS/T4P/T4SS family [Kiritimatiellia bacterium]MDP6809807.1 ATPase, T2SS/T4P/T4SS family [Kiritimatiellia bacterium]MDP7025083.1 ATPase, T2SS/T4P/T4SS family [Kiritimatiellia bacterium]
MAGNIQLDIRRPNGDVTSVPVSEGIYTIGRDDDCNLHLPHIDVDPRHAILTISEAGSSVEDLASESGTFVSGIRVEGNANIPASADLTIGPFVISVRAEGVDAPPVPAPRPEPDVAPPVPEAVPESTASPVGEATPPRQTSRERAIKQQIHTELLKRLDIKRLAASHIDEKELQDRALSTIGAIVQDVQDRLPPGIEPEALTRQIYNEAVGLGPLVDLLDDEDITEIMVNGHDHVYVERNGRLELSSLTFMDDSSVMAIIERIVSPLGRRVDESQPYVDARLPDGSRVNAIIPPLSLTGPSLTIRKFAKIPFTEVDFIRFNTLTPEIVEFVKLAVVLRKNIVISGGTGSGKTSLLNVLSSFLPESDRIVTIEDAAELRLKQDHIVRLEARPPNIEGRGQITIRDLVRNALRMRPDRVVVGECRGGEALDMLQAMNTGHDGSLTTVHANAPRDVISRLETMVLMSGMDLPVRAIREQIASAIDLIVHESRMSDGSRKVTQVTEVIGLEGDQVVMQDIFEFVQTGVDSDGRVEGHFQPTGSVPTFVDQIESRGLTIERSIFDPRKDLNQ